MPVQLEYREGIFVFLKNEGENRQYSLQIVTKLAQSIVRRHTVQ